MSDSLPDRLLLMGILAVCATALAPTHAFASPPAAVRVASADADISGDYAQTDTVTSTGDVYHVSLTLTQGASGDLTGTGIAHNSLGDHAYTVTGQVSGSSITYKRSDKDSSYIADFTGTVSGDTLSGTWTDSNGLSGTWIATRGPRGPNVTIDWTMPERLTDAIQERWTRRGWYGLPSWKYINPTSWEVNLFLTREGKPACPPGVAYRWRVIGEGIDESLPDSGCKVRTTVPKLGRYRVTATEVSGGTAPGTVIENDNVVVRDWLIVGLGDSNGSGEGNPPFVFPQCDRSLSSYQYRTAKYIEDHDPRSSVTFLFASCSGARTDHLWKNAYAGIQPSEGPPLPPQIDQVKQRLGKRMPRKVDAVIMSIGINDLYFGSIMEFCILAHLNTYDEGCAGHWVKPVKDARGYVTEYESDDANHQGRARYTATLLYQTNTRVQALPGKFAAVSSHLAAINPSHVFLTQYPAIAHDFSGKLCTAGEGAFPAFSQSTWQWLSNVGDALNNAVLASAAAYGWTGVTGIPEGFFRHGYCAGTQSYFRSLRQALPKNKDGTFHPNPRGHAVSYQETKASVCEALYGNQNCDGLPPAP